MALLSAELPTILEKQQRISKKILTQNDGQRLLFDLRNDVLCDSLRLEKVLLIPFDSKMHHIYDKFDWKMWM